MQGYFAEILFVAVYEQHTIKSLFHVQHEIILLFLSSTKLFFPFFMPEIGCACLRKVYSQGSTKFLIFCWDGCFLCHISPGLFMFLVILEQHEVNIAVPEQHKMIN
jgi:hypothetical protein